MGNMTGFIVSTPENRLILGLELLDIKRMLEWQVSYLGRQCQGHQEYFD